MSEHEHLDEELCDEFWLGRLAPEQARAVEQQAAACNICRERLETAGMFYQSFRDVQQ